MCTRSRRERIAEPFFHNAILAAARFEIANLAPELSEKMKIVPLGDKVVLRRVDAEETTAGGIVLPDSAQEKPRQGRVLSVGDGVLLKDGSRASHDVGEGDRVIYSLYTGTEITVEGEELLILGENDILAIVS